MKSEFHKGSVIWPQLLMPKILTLEHRLKSWDRVAVAFSGGVDSTFLAAMACRALGDGALAVTARSASIPKSEIRQTETLARWMGIRHLMLETQECDLPEYIRNAPDRCYHCKRHIFTHLVQAAAREGFDVVIDGSNTDDARDVRPGARAIQELGIHSPLAVHGFSKSDIRVASQVLGLPTADKPALACLATRVAFGVPLSEILLNRIGAAEEVLLRMGFRVVRARTHSSTNVRIELDPSELSRAMTPGVRETIVEELKKLGFRHIALDMEGYRMGSWND